VLPPPLVVSATSRDLEESQRDVYRQARNSFWPARNQVLLAWPGFSKPFLLAQHFAHMMFVRALRLNLVEEP
jgi:hypothetical protein